MGFSICFWPCKCDWLSLPQQYFIYSCILGLISCSVFLRINFELKMVIMTAAVVAYNIIILQTHAPLLDHYSMALYNSTRRYSAPHACILMHTHNEWMEGWKKNGEHRCSWKMWEKLLLKESKISQHVGIKLNQSVPKIIQFLLFWYFLSPSLLLFSVLVVFVWVWIEFTTVLLKVKNKDEVYTRCTFYLCFCLRFRFFYFSLFLDQVSLKIWRPWALYHCSFSSSLCLCWRGRWVFQMRTNMVTKSLCC